jgi:hypothetical protein
MMGKAQISIEYMSIMGFVLVIILFLIILSQVYSRRIEDQITINQIDRLVKELIDSAESVYYFGEPTQTTVKAYMPEKVERINVTQEGISFLVRTQYGVTDIAYSSSVILNGSISKEAGMKNIRLEAREGYVWVES